VLPTDPETVRDLGQREQRLIGRHDARGYSPRRTRDSRTLADLPGRLLGMCEWLSWIIWGIFVIDFVSGCPWQMTRAPPIFHRVSYE
jgi:hypothetical protein